MTTQARSAVRRIALARVISMTGGAASFAALNFVIYQRTHSPTWVAAALFLTFGTVGFASIFAGALGDRFDRKRVMVLSDLSAAACFLAMAFIRDPGVLLAVAFLSALAESPFFAASAAAIPNLVPEDQVSWANGTVSVGVNTGILVGPLIGGVLVASIGAGAVFAINAVSFVGSAALTWTVRGRFSEDTKARGEHAGVLAGFRFLVQEPVLRACALAYLPIMLGLGMTMVADVPLVAVFGAGAAGYGVLISCWGGGSILGSLGGRFLNGRTEPIAFVVGGLIVAVTGVLTGASPWFWGVLVSIFFMGVADGTQVVAQRGITQRRTPDAVRSRVSSAIDAAAHISLAISYAVAGPIVAAVGPRWTYVLGGLVGVLSLAAAVPVIRARREPDVGERREAASSDAGSLVYGYPAGETETTASTR